MSNGSPAAGPYAGAPVCPRHQDRVAYVRCQRCERPVCGECQRQAAVGIQCVDCVHQAQANAPKLRTEFGGLLKPGRPIVTLTIIALCVLVYALQWLIPNDQIFRDFAFFNFLATSEPWRLLTSAFLHSQGFVLHLVLNMYTLYIFGQALEPRLGRFRFAVIYLLAAVGGSVGYFLLTPVVDPSGYAIGVVGASGAIFGLFGAMIIIQRKSGGPIRSLLVLLLINAVIGFMFSGIAWQAHLGGLIVGFAAAGVLTATQKSQRRNLYQGLGFAAIAVALVVLVLLRAQALGV